MISFIDEHRGVFGQMPTIGPICRLLPIAPSTYFENVAMRLDADRLSVRARSDIGLKIEIRRVFYENCEVYGVRKVWRQLLREGFEIARCTVARLMMAMGLQGIIRGKPIRTTISGKAAPCPLDRVNRQFFASAPNMLWLSDFTYVATWQGLVYVAFVIDAFARRIVGWRASRTPMRASSSMPWTRRFMIGGPSIAVGSSTIPIGVCNTCPFAIPSDWRRRASSPPSELLATAMTMLSLKLSTVFTRQRSFIGEDHGATSKLWSSPHSNGSIGSTTAVFWSP
ncbi:hypothetical protein J3A65_000874 [Rhizobium sp. PvP014]|nr:hypothetical protein [Rhizobium sp. PvP014]MBP2531483.1 hypothetical protein [Rhizobium sp. PvP099]